MIWFKGKEKIVLGDGYNTRVNLVEFLNLVKDKNINISFFDWDTRDDELTNNMFIITNNGAMMKQIKYIKKAKDINIMAHSSYEDEYKMIMRDKKLKDLLDE